MSSLQSFVVIGGEGFLGGRMVTMLLERYPQAAVASFDVVQRHTTGRQTFKTVDLTELESLTTAMQQVAATCVLHTAATHPGAPKAVAVKVNIEGTRNVIEACRRAGVRRLVYTSSAGAYFDGTDNIDIDERMPAVGEEIDPYNWTKAEAEKLVLDANGKGNLLTCSIRPSGIYGPGDRQNIPPILKAFKDGKTGIIIGNNENLFDWTYVDNIVHAHLLAAEKLDKPTEPTSYSIRASEVDLTLQRRPVPSSIRREDAKWLPFETPVSDGPLDPPLKAGRTRLDQFWTRPELAVAGQAFFITNGEPIFFWDHVRSIHFIYAGFDNASTVFRLPAAIALLFAALYEFICRLTGEADPAFSKYRVTIMRTVRYHNIERARKVLGYEPLVGYWEGLERAIEWYKSLDSSAPKA